jgi:hypothetical protein
MIRSARTASKEKLSRREEAAARSRAEKDPGIWRSRHLFGIQEDFPKLRGEAHEQELMIFAAEEYDAGASLHIRPASQLVMSREFKSCLKRGTTSFKIRMNVIKCLSC